MEATTLYHPQFGGVVKATLEAQPSDDEGTTALTIARMAQYVREDSRNPLIRRIAHQALADRPGLDPAAAVFWWVRGHIQFQQDAAIAAGITADPDATEVLIRPVDLVTMPEPKGDCDCQAMLCAAMLRALGIESQFRTIKANPDEPELWSHVYVIARRPDGELALDCSHGDYPGWELPAQEVLEDRLWPIEEESMRRLGELPEWATDAISTGVEATSKILTSRYATPQLKPGTYIQTPQGIVYQQPAGSGALAFPGASLNLGSSSSLILIVGAIAVLLLVSKR